MEIVRAPGRLDHSGQRFFIHLEPRREMRIVVRRPRPVPRRKSLIDERVYLDVDLFSREPLQADEIVTLFRQLVDAQQLEVSRRRNADGP